MGLDDEVSLRPRVEAEVVRCADLVVAATDDERDQLVRLLRRRPERIEIVHQGVDHTLFAPGDQAAAKRSLGVAGRPVLLFVGRIQPLKGADLAVRAPRRAPRPAGGARGRRAARAVPRARASSPASTTLVDELGLTSRVRFVPPQPHEQLARYYQAADVCVVPSRSESFGLVALEAAACGTPVVASNVGGLRIVVDDGVTGLLVDERDPRAFADAIEPRRCTPSTRRWRTRRSRHAVAGSAGASRPPACAGTTTTSRARAPVQCR